MGNGTEVPVIGYCNSCIKLDGKIIQLSYSLHVPGINYDLFSGTRHGTNGVGSSLMIHNGSAILSFPSFVIEQMIPGNLDLTIDLEPLTESD